VLRAASWDALEAVVPHIRRLAELEAGREALQAAGTDKGRQPQAAGATKECLQAIGEHIEGGACWMVPVGGPAILWRAVATFTGHRMDQHQLASLYRGLKLQCARDAAGGAGGAAGTAAQQTCKCTAGVLPRRLSVLAVWGPQLRMHTGQGLQWQLLGQGVRQ
jgi:hypothetical protein